MVRDKWTGKTKGYGFVSFANASDLTAAMKEMNGCATFATDSVCVLYIHLILLFHHNHNHCRQICWKSAYQIAKEHLEGSNRL